MRAAAAALLLLAACATGPSIPEPYELDSALKTAYVGQPIETVLARYGVPQSQFETNDGIRVLVWTTDRTMRFHEDVTTTTRGSVGDQAAYPFLAAVPYRETTTTRQGYNVDLTCTLQVGMTEAGTVHGVGAYGKMGACQNFMP